MESQLPLMEMAEEDDSLLPDLNFNQTPSKSSLNYFTCSPFALPPSHTKNLKDSVRTEKPSSSSSEASNNKENINSNDVEVPKLGMESMQMKRRKKGSGYNLRKSLAWDRAFFTEEGILDPLELTLITGINANTRGGGLPTISEEGNSSFSSEVGCRNECNDKNCISKGKKEKTRYSVGNHESLPHHKVTQKALSVNRTKRDPLAASSLKRPANSDTLKISKKESKLTIPPISKPGSCFSATKKGSMSASKFRCNLIPKPIINVQKNVRLKSSVQNVHGSHSKAKTGNLHKEVAQKTLRNLTNSSKAASTTKSRLQLCEIQQEPAPLAAEVLAHHNNAEHLRKSLPKADRLHPCQSQEHPAALARPSGLRLPSPSLRFFDQSSSSPSYMVNTNKGVLDSNISQNQETEIIPRVYQNYDDKVTFVRETEGKLLLHNEENILHNDYYSTALMSKSGQPVQHQKQQNMSSGVDVSTDFTHDLAQTSKDTEQSAAFKVNPVSHLWVSPGLEYDSVDVRRGHEDFVAEKNINQGNCSNFNRENQPSEPQGFVELDSDVVQEGKTPMLGDFQHGSDGGREIKAIVRVDQNYDDKDPFVLETEDKLVLHNEENTPHNDNYSSVLLSISGKPIQHQEQQNISSKVDVSTDLTHDLAQTLEATERSDAFEVNPESHLWVSPGLEYDSVDEKRGEEDFVAEKDINQGNCSNFNGEHQPSEPQGFVEVDSEVVQEGKTPMLGDFQHGSDGGSEIQAIVRVDQHYNDKEPFVHETEDKLVLHNEENILHNDNYSSVLMSKSEQPIQHQEKQNILSRVDVRTDLTHDLAQTLKATKKSDAFEVNPETHLWVSPGLEYDSVDEKRGQEDVTGKNKSQGNFSKFKEENQPSEPQGFVEVDSEVVREGKTPTLGDFQHDGGSDLNDNKDACHATMVIKSSNTINRQDNSLVIHPPNAVPFSDEWLAAIEAAGEEILTMKRGAVQHSPPDKSLPEPSPWSPVKKKSNQIGPYDCTKYGNAMPSNSQ